LEMSVLGLGFAGETGEAISYDNKYQLVN